MSLFGKLGLRAWLLLLLLAAGGCMPVDSNQMDEEKEPHYVLGKNRVNARDFTGAIEAFQEALEANPRSAPAHFQLACLYDSQAPDPAAAIFHYQEYLRLNPQAGNLDVIRGHIYTCKQQLAADIMPLPSAPAAQKQLESLAAKNHEQQQQIDALTEQLRVANEQLRQWNVYYASQQGAAKTAAAQINNRPAPPANSSMPDDMTLAPADSNGAAAPRPGAVPTTGSTPVNGHPMLVRPARPAVAAAPRARTHAVQPGETLAGIARKAGVTLAALKAANPGVNPKKLRAGQVLNLPGQ